MPIDSWPAGQRSRSVRRKFLEDPARSQCSHTYTHSQSYISNDTSHFIVIARTKHCSYLLSAILSIDGENSWK